MVVATALVPIVVVVVSFCHRCYFPLLLFHISNVGVPLLLLLLLPLLLLLTNVGILLADVDLTILFVVVVASSGVVAILAGVPKDKLNFHSFNTSKWIGLFFNFISPSHA